MAMVEALNTEDSVNIAWWAELSCIRFEEKRFQKGSYCFKNDFL